MTELRVQTLSVPCCEEAIEREYFGWGQVQDKSASRLDWSEATLEERALVAGRGYALYDGLPTFGGNHLGALEVYSTIGVNSRVTLNDAVRFLTHAEKAGQLLAEIPDDASLEAATDDQIASAGSLIEVFQQERHVGWAKITKTLHKKRPAFIPMLDSVVSDFEWKNFPHFLNQGSLPLVVWLAGQGRLVRFRQAVADHLGRAKRRRSATGGSRNLAPPPWVALN